MSEHFNWQTEDEGEWADPPDRSSPSSGPRKRWKKWAVALALAIGFIAAVSVIYFRVQTSLNEVEASRTAEILSSYQLIEDAILQGDAELYTTFLSGADLAWATGQQELFRNGWLLDRRAFGLGQAPFEVDEPTVELSPKLNSA